MTWASGIQVVSIYTEHPTLNRLPWTSPFWNLKPGCNEKKSCQGRAFLVSDLEVAFLSWVLSTGFSITTNKPDWKHKEESCWQVDQVQKECCIDSNRQQVWYVIHPARIQPGASRLPKGHRSNIIMPYNKHPWYKVNTAVIFCSANHLLYLELFVFIEKYLQSKYANVSMSVLAALVFRFNSSHQRIFEKCGVLQFHETKPKRSDCVCN